MVSHVNHIVLRCSTESHARDSVVISAAPPSSLHFPEEESPFFFGFRIFYKTAVLSYCLSSLSSPGSRRGSPWHNDPLQTGSGTPFPLSLARGEVSLELGCSNGSRSHSRRGPRCYAVLGSKYIHSFSCVSNLWTS